jgi:hypothetical protein
VLTAGGACQSDAVLVEYLPGCFCMADVPWMHASLVIMLRQAAFFGFVLGRCCHGMTAANIVTKEGFVDVTRVVDGVF